MNLQESAARHYCQSIGADPDEFVGGTVQGIGGWINLPRWQWYVRAPVLTVSRAPSNIRMISDHTRCEDASSEPQ